MKLYVAIATLTSVLPRFPLERLSCHVFHWNVSLATFVKMYVAIATFSTGTSLLPRLWRCMSQLQRWRRSCHVCEDVCRNCHVNVALAMFSTGTSLLPRFPLERHSFHVCEDVCRNCHVNVALATFSTGTSLLPRFPLEHHSCHICEDVCRNCDVFETRFSPPTVTLGFRV